MGKVDELVEGEKMGKKKLSKKSAKLSRHNARFYATMRKMWQETCKLASLHRQSTCWEKKNRDKEKWSGKSLTRRKFGRDSTCGACWNSISTILALKQKSGWNGDAISNALYAVKYFLLVSASENSGKVGYFPQEGPHPYRENIRLRNHRNSSLKNVEKTDLLV